MKKIGKNSKFQIFAKLYTTLVETLPRSMHELFGVNLCCTFRGDVVKVFSPMWSHVNENDKKS